MTDVFGMKLRSAPKGERDDKSASDLRRVGLASQEQFQDRGRPFDAKDAAAEALMRALPQIQQTLEDIRMGTQTRSNWVNAPQFDTNSVPATGNGVIFEAAKMTGGYPFDTLTIDSVGGAGTSMTLSVNGCEPFGVVAGDVFDNMEIWQAVLRVGTGGAGTARIVVTSYVPGIRGLRGF